MYPFLINLMIFYKVTFSSKIRFRVEALPYYTLLFTNLSFKTFLTICPSYKVSGFQNSRAALRKIQVQCTHVFDFLCTLLNAVGKWIFIILFVNSLYFVTIQSRIFLFSFQPFNVKEGMRSSRGIFKSPKMIKMALNNILQSQNKL